MSLAEVYLDLGELDAAERYVKEALAVAEKLYPPGDLVASPAEASAGSPKNAEIKPRRGSFTSG